MMNDESQTITALGSSPDGAVSGSNTAMDDKQTAESSTVEGATQPKTLSDAIAKALEDSGSVESPGSEPNPEDGEVAGKPTDEAKPETKPEPTVPFHKHPRWIEKQTQIKNLSTQVDTLKSQASMLEELRQSTGGEQGLENLRHLARAYANDPARAVEMLEKLKQDAMVRSGKVLNDDEMSKDLREKVDDGLLDEESALEIQQARMAKRQGAERQVQDNHQGMVSALNAWESNLKERDLNWDRLKEAVADRMTVLASQSYPRDANEAVALATRAFSEVKARNATSARAPIKPLRSTASSSTVRPASKSLHEIVRNALRASQ